MICKSEAEIEDWMYDKYIVVMKNEKKFIDHKFGSTERIEQSASFTWHPLTIITRIDYVNMVERTYHEMNDNLWNLGRMTMDEDDGFVI